MSIAIAMPTTGTLPQAFAAKAAFASWHAAACAESSYLLPEEAEESLSQTVWGPAQALWKILRRAARTADADELERRVNDLATAVDARMAMPIDYHDEIETAWRRATEISGALLDWLRQLRPLQNVSGALGPAASPSSPHAPRTPRRDLRVITDICALSVNRRTRRVDYTHAAGTTASAHFSGNSLKMLWCLADPDQPRKTKEAIWKEGWRGNVEMGSVSQAKFELVKELKSRQQNASLWTDLARRVKNRKRLYFVDLSLTGRRQE